MTTDNQLRADLISCEAKLIAALARAEAAEKKLKELESWPHCDTLVGPEGGLCNCPLVDLGEPFDYICPVCVQRDRADAAEANTVKVLLKLNEECGVRADAESKVKELERRLNASNGIITAKDAAIVAGLTKVKELEAQISKFQHARDAQRKREFGSIHPEDFCQACCDDKPAVWFTDNDLWNQYSRGMNILCLSCFVQFAHKLGFDGVWKLTTEEKIKELEAKCGELRGVFESFRQPSGCFCECEYEHTKECVAVTHALSSDCGKGWRSPQEYAELGKRLLDLQNQFMAFQRASNERIESLKGHKSPAEVREMLEDALDYMRHAYMRHAPTCPMPAAPCDCGLTSIVAHFEALVKEAK